ncbi:MAG: 23S rRNA (adenine(2030)-N(6))-methyltransferase RlmJ [Gammaproteobacteria bacterium]|nr:23S rRNA (adenine(2030)-N(6))-methyltransferase RlmJ [Gammaproteobacteria bacterium]MDP2142092.1 23S rRNA (adenine(2030)-N(6))-methyltransferase RlmJ [Gammaproteobacteria bacterium]MDP2347253.1 23S rRNA (adenine(2030)-N(6))-methyltransferase RlmJ [Gammaproteobacteria bacterium]
MLSYRHGYHAGNHADVVKHLVLLGLLQKMLAKDKPFTYIDSHSGAGLYNLDSQEARLNAEHLSGVVRLWQDRGSDPLLNLYLDKVSEFNSARALHHYPGSPALAFSCLRPDDRMHLLELHPAEVETLRFNMGRDSRVSIHHRDAFEGLLALTPPEPRRGLALIDPAFEDKDDYQRVLNVLVKLQRRWPVGVLALWYPMLARQRDRSIWLKAAIKRENLPDVLSVELVVQDQEEEFGMHGSGMLIINAPWQFREQIQATFTEVVSVLGDGAQYHCEVLTTSAHKA